MPLYGTFLQPCAPRVGELESAATNRLERREGLEESGEQDCSPSCPGQVGLRAGLESRPGSATDNIEMVGLPDRRWAPAGSSSSGTRPGDARANQPCLR